VTKDWEGDPFRPLLEVDQKDLMERLCDAGPAPVAGDVSREVQSAQVAGSATSANGPDQRDDDKEETITNGWQITTRPPPRVDYYRDRGKIRP